MLFLANLRSLVLFTASAVAAISCASHARAETAQRLTPHIVTCRVGFDGHFKVGHWTGVHVVVAPGAADAAELTVEIEAVDSDGVATVVSNRVANSKTAETTRTSYAKIGRLNSPIHVRLKSGQQIVDERTLPPATRQEGDSTLTALPATAEVFVTLGTTPFGFSEAFIERPASANAPARRVVSLTSIGDLTDEWFGYESVDVLVLSIGDGSLWQELAADKRRYDALQKWVDLGGRLVVFFGGRAERELTAPGADLAAFQAILSLLPGQFAAVDRLPQTGAVEHYAQSDVAIVPPGMRSELSVVQLKNPIGRVELFGTGIAQTPLVIRAPRGLGEITFVGLDLDASPLADWPGRASFLRAVMRPLVVEDEPVDAARTLVTSGYDDLSGALRQRLGQAFAGVRPISFRAVVGLSMLYLLVLFPLDYYLVHRWLRRPWLAWVTFPLILFAFGAGALVLADSRDTAPGPSMNRIELVDVDISSGRVRGTFWASLYSPQSRRFDVRFDARFPADEPADAESLLSWHGLAGTGIGGMSGGGASFAVVQDSYAYASRHELDGVPILTSATKSFIARWTAETSPLMDSQLADDDGMLTGSLANRTGMTLRNARLIYGTWAYRLKDVEPEATVELSDELTPISLQTLMTSLATGDSVGAPQGSERAAVSADQASPAQLLNLMMFFRAVGGAAFARLPLRYQSDCDFSRQLELGRAVLVAEVATAGSRLVEGHTGQPFDDNADSASPTIYRFVLPVTKAKDSQ